MGIFFWIHSVALVEDLSVKEPGEYASKQEFVTAMEGSYNQVGFMNDVCKNHICSFLKENNKFKKLV